MVLNCVQNGNTFKHFFFFFIQLVFTGTDLQFTQEKFGMDISFARIGINKIRN